MENTNTNPNNKVRYNENVNIKTGRIGHVEIKDCKNGKKVAKVALYVNEIIGPKGDDGKYPTKTTRHSVVIFEGGKYITPFSNLATGAVIRCVGRDENTEFTKEDGTKVYDHRIVANSVSLVAAPKDKDNAETAAAAADPDSFLAPEPGSSTPWDE